MAGKPCPHCGNPLANRPRGLCWNCHNDVEIRHRYESGSKYAVKGNGLKQPTTMPVPTCAQPGSEAKIRVLTDRVARGEVLFHPNDYVPARKVA